MISFLTKCASDILALLFWFGFLECYMHKIQHSPVSAPRLDGGFFSPKQETYSNGTTLTYTCHEGRKPPVKGWWATSTCENGKWSHQPQCIDEKACFPPIIPNAKYTENSNGWYEEGDIIRTTCDEGYEHKDRSATARCTNGAWSSLPICEKRIDSCSEPPKVAHAIIIHQRYQEVFAADSEVQYECEDGYMMQGADTTNPIFCIGGTWTEGPTCRSSTSSRPNERVIQTQIIPKDECGAPPTILNGDVLGSNQMFLKYQCNSFYTLMGPQRVYCYADGTWSKLPTCK
ncbi:complement factor H-like protein, partial [Lates japonicus]